MQPVPEWPYPPTLAGVCGHEGVGLAVVPLAATVLWLR
jgi:hypothetical protein